LNALTFGALMTAYLVWRGMRLETVGIWRGISSAVGLAGTFVYHESVKRTTLVNTGMWSIIYEFACLSICFASLFVHDFNTSMGMLIAGACASRIGLWVFDIAVTQLMQEFIPDGIRGSVGGTQQSLNAFFSLFSFGLGLIFPDPREFHIYIAAGYGAVGVAAIMYALGVYIRRDEFLTSSEKEARYSI
jgi:iron-regulated transporter 1